LVVLFFAAVVCFSCRSNCIGVVPIVRLTMYLDSLFSVHFIQVGLCIHFFRGLPFPFIKTAVGGDFFSISLTSLHEVFPEGPCPSKCDAVCSLFFRSFCRCEASQALNPIKPISHVAPRTYQVRPPPLFLSSRLPFRRSVRHSWLSTFFRIHL